MNRHEFIDVAALCAVAGLWIGGAVATDAVAADNWRFCEPDYAVLVPDSSLWGNDNHHKIVNEHFHVLESPKSGDLFAFWTQESFEGSDDMVGQWEGRGPLYRYDGTFDAKVGQPVRFTKREILLKRSGSSHYGNSCYSSFTKRGDERVLWFPDNKFYLLGKIIKRRARDAFLREDGSRAPRRRAEARGGEVNRQSGLCFNLPRKNV